MKMSKIIALLLALVLVMSLAACGGSNSAPTSNAPASKSGDSAAKEEPAAEKSDAKIVLSRWAGDNADIQKEIVKDYTGATIVVDDIDYENLKEKQIQSMSSSAEYDLIWVAEVWLPEYVKNGWLLPLDDFIANSDINMGDYSQGIIDINTVDGKLYAMPDMMQGQIMTYNSEWFDREGQKVPTTMDELLQVAKYFKEQGSGIAIPAKQGQAAMDTFVTILYSAGGDYFDENGNLDLTNEKVLYAADVFDKLCQYSMDGSTAWHNDQVSEAIRTGKAPFGFTVSGLSAQDKDPDKSVIVDSVGYSTIPSNYSVAGCVSTWSWGIAANSKDPQAAWEAAKWLVSAETEKQMALKAGHTSACSALTTDAEVVSAIPFLDALVAQMAKGKTEPTSTDAAELAEPFIAALSKIATTDESPADVMAELQKQLGHIKITR